MFPAVRKEKENMYEELRLNIVAEETAVYHTYKDSVFLFCGAGAEKPRDHEAGKGSGGGN